MGGDSCVAVGCNTNYNNCTENVSVFTFPSEKKDPDLRRKWLEFVNRGDNWKPNDRSVLCANHFEKIYLNAGEKRTHLKRKMHPIPTIHTEEPLQKPANTRTPVPPRKAPKVRVFQEDELSMFRNLDSVKSIDDLSAAAAPPGYEFRMVNGNVVIYKLEFDPITSFPKVFGSISIDRDLHVNLQCNGSPLPLPLWFTVGRNAKLWTNY